MAPLNTLIVLIVPSEYVENVLLRHQLAGGMLLFEIFEYLSLHNKT